MSKIRTGTAAKADFLKEFSGTCTGIKPIKEDEERGTLLVLSTEEDNVLIYGQQFQKAVWPGKKIGVNEEVDLQELVGQNVSLRKGTVTVSPN